MNDCLLTSVSMGTLVVLSVLLTVLYFVEVAFASTDPSIFTFGRLSRLNVTVACGKNTSADTRCISNTSMRVPCSACDALTNIRDLLKGDNKEEWRSVTGRHFGQTKEVIITIELGQALLVERVGVTSGSSPLPAIWVLERLGESSANFEPWRYYVTSPEECVNVFGVHHNSGSAAGNPAAVPICAVRKNRTHSEHLQENVLVTAVRLRLLRPREGWAGPDSSELDFYSLSKLLLEGRCTCNGHAHKCELSREGIMQCACENNTCGVNCESCCHGYERTAGTTCQLTGAATTASITKETVAATQTAEEATTARPTRNETTESRQGEGIITEASRVDEITSGTEETTTVETTVANESTAATTTTSDETKDSTTMALEEEEMTTATATAIEKEAAAITTGANETIVATTGVEKTTATSEESTAESLTTATATSEDTTVGTTEGDQTTAGTTGVEKTTATSEESTAESLTTATATSEDTTVGTTEGDQTEAGTTAVDETTAEPTTEFTAAETTTENETTAITIGDETTAATTTTTGATATATEDTTIETRATDETTAGTTTGEDETTAASASAEETKYVTTTTSDEMTEPTTITTDEMTAAEDTAISGTSADENTVTSAVTEETTATTSAATSVADKTTAGAEKTTSADMTAKTKAVEETTSADMTAKTKAVEETTSATTRATDEPTAAEETSTAEETTTATAAAEETTAVTILADGATTADITARTKAVEEMTATTTTTATAAAVAAANETTVTEESTARTAADETTAATSATTVADETTATEETTTAEMTAETKAVEETTATTTTAAAATANETAVTEELTARTAADETTAATTVTDETTAAEETTTAEMTAETKVAGETIATATTVADETTAEEETTTATIVADGTTTADITAETKAADETTSATSAATVADETTTATIVADGTTTADITAETKLVDETTASTSATKARTAADETTTANETTAAEETTTPDITAETKVVEETTASTSATKARTAADETTTANETTAAEETTTADITAETKAADEKTSATTVADGTTTADITVETKLVDETTSATTTVADETTASTIVAGGTTTADITAEIKAADEKTSATTVADETTTADITAETKAADEKTSSRTVADEMTTTVAVEETTADETTATVAVEETTAHETTAGTAAEETTESTTIAATTTTAAAVGETTATIAAAETTETTAVEETTPTTADETTTGISAEEETTEPTTIAATTTTTAAVGETTATIAAAETTETTAVEETTPTTADETTTGISAEEETTEPATIAATTAAAAETTETAVEETTPTADETTTGTSAEEETTEKTTIAATTTTTTTITTAEGETTATIADGTTAGTTTEETTESTTVADETTITTAADETTARITTADGTTEATTATDSTTAAMTTVPTTTTSMVPITTETSEAEFRKYYGDLPEGVCYCNVFATKKRKCFPPAIGKPCECMGNYGGDRCDRCARGYYLFAFCFACKCNFHGSTSLACNPSNGQCPCKAGMRGRRCDSCPVGFFNFPKCEPCQCNLAGSYGRACDPVTGQCSCRHGIRGQRCEQCPRGYFKFPRCLYCGCNPLSTTRDICDNNGICLCKENYQGFLCGECRRGYFDFPFCSACPCSPGAGSCNVWGRCECLPGFTGQKCERCKDGYHGFPKCQACNCDNAGALSKVCDKTTGSCTCKANIRGLKCDRCASGLLFFPSCVSCDCNPNGVRKMSSVSSMSCGRLGQCICKENVGGPSCDRCRYGFHNFTASNPLGCTSCSCSRSGTVAGTSGCSAPLGRCDCKSHMTGIKCKECKEGYHWPRPHDIFGCRACKCHPGGAMSSFCNRSTGICQCRPNVGGKRCGSIDTSRPLYVPTLYHISAELETGVIESGALVPLRADSRVFPSFSGDGYVMPPADKPFSVTVVIPRTSTYRLIFHYVLAGMVEVSVRVNLTPEGSAVASHQLEAVFLPRAPWEQSRDKLMTVKENGNEAELLMEKGRWTVTLTSGNSSLLLDYVVFLPAEYYKAEVLLGFDLEPCTIQGPYSDYCYMYTYYEPSGAAAVTVRGYSGYANKDDPSFGRLQTYRDSKITAHGLSLGRMALLGRTQRTLFLSMPVVSSGPHVLVLKYLHLERSIRRIYVSVQNQRGTTEILPCKYSFGCRQVVLNDERGAKSFQLTANSGRNVVKLETSSSARVALISVTAIPEKDWTSEWIRPSMLCRWQGKSCSSSSYGIPRGAVKLEKTNNEIEHQYSGQVTEGGKFNMIIQYRQPNAISVAGELSFLSNGSSSTLSLKFPFCSNLGGCRLVVGKEKRHTFELGKAGVVAKLKHAEQTKVEFVLLVPSKDFSATLTKPHASEKVSHFMKKCAKEEFHITPTAGQTCRDAVFTLTAEFNNGPLACNCNRLGSNSIFCDPFGGQCSCKPFIVGRTCHKCRAGYSGLPYCRRCNCSPYGSASQDCDRLGRCKCRPGFGGYKCTRCTSHGYYGYPKCKPCSCHEVGSLSMFCRSRDGQCQCRRSFQGVKCDECRIGFFDFPDCKKCNCNPAGIKRLAGQGDCNAVNGSSCTCKDNVQGEGCGECKDLYYNLQFYNPLGCSRCRCHGPGTTGNVKSCDKVTGQCTCKPHVTGQNCDRCRSGYYHLEGPNVFGCRHCSCDVGGSYGTTCNDVTGKCQCVRGVGGNDCNRPTSKEFYFPDLHHIKFELEDGKTPGEKPVAIGHNVSLFPGFSWRGYVRLSHSQRTVQMLVNIPVTTRYRLIFYYNLKQYATLSALVRMTPTLDSALLQSGYATQQSATVSFRSTASWLYAVPELMTASDSLSIPVEFILSQGKWKLVIHLNSNNPSSDLLVDYLVLLPKEYYQPSTLKQRISNACEMGRSPELCVYYTYPSLDEDGFVSIQAEGGNLFGPRARYPHLPFRGAVLTGTQNVLVMTVPSGTEGKFALIASYFRSQLNSGPLTVVMRSKSHVERANIYLLSCRYPFACRQVAVDNNHKVRLFTLGGNGLTTFSVTTRHAVALDSITIIPGVRWSAEYIVPVEQCVKRGATCVSSRFHTPSDAVLFRAKNTTRHHRQPTYLLDRRMVLQFINVGQNNLYLSGTVPSGRYVIVAHFFQPNHLSFTGKAIISGLTSTSALLRLRYCPHVAGCRILGMSATREGMTQYVYIRQRSNVLLTFIIPKDKSVWINHVMLVPSRSISTSALLATEPMDLSRDFVHECGQHSFVVKPSASAFCLKSVFSLVTNFNSGALPCGCDSLGSLGRTCRSFGGQCGCRANVIGRSCDRCKTGYKGFPYCVRGTKR